jgi:hypothetical protein
MPRRKPKNLWKPGESGNPAGRPVGSLSEINAQVKQAFAMLLHSQLPNMEKWLADGAKRDPLKTAELMLRFSERFTPSLSRQEISGPNGEAFTPITINIPTFHLPKPDTTIEIGEGSLTKIGEGNTVIGKDTSHNRIIGEGSPAEDSGQVQQVGEGAFTDNPQNAGDSEITPPGEDSSEDSPEFVFLPADLVSVPPPGYRKEF